MVSVGEDVVKGQTIGAAPEGTLGVAVHASIAGQVVGVTKQAILIQAGPTGKE